MPGLAAPLAFNVLAAENGVVQLQFELDEATQVALHAWLTPSNEAAA